jgi:hypothetical protein
VGELRSLTNESRSLGARIFVLAVNADPERTSHPTNRIPNWHHDRAVDSRQLRAWAYISSAVNLDVASRNRFVALCGNPGHSFTYRDLSYDLHNFWRETDMSLEDENPVFEQVDGSSVRPELVKDCFQLRFH